MLSFFEVITTSHDGYIFCTTFHSVSIKVTRERRSRGKRWMRESTFDLVVVGAGPGGLSAAAHASQQGMSHVLLEAGGAHANTIQQYQRHNHVMAEPSVLPLRSDIEFAAGRREAILETWERGMERANVNIRYRSEVTGISGTRGSFYVARVGQSLDIGGIGEYSD